MNDYREMIGRMANEVRRFVMQYCGETWDKCDFAADELALRLHESGIDARIVKGTFLVDHASEDELERENAEHLMRHVWVEVGNEIVDATADQFNDLLYEPMQTIFIGANAHYRPECCIEPRGMMRVDPLPDD